MKILNRCSKFSKTATFKVNIRYILSPQSLDYMLKYMAAHPVAKSEKFGSRLLALLSHKPPPAGDPEKIAKILSALPNLKKDPELGAAAVSKVTELLGLSVIPALDKDIANRCEVYYKCNMLRNPAFELTRENPWSSVCLTAATSGTTAASTKKYRIRPASSGRS